MKTNEERKVKENDSAIRSYTVETPVEEFANGRVYFTLPNGKLYYMDGDSDEVYLVVDKKQN